MHKVINKKPIVFWDPRLLAMTQRCVITINAIEMHFCC